MTILEDNKILHGTNAWFDMVGALLMEAATQARLPLDFNVSLVERYTDGTAQGDGLVLGMRFEIINGSPSFRRGSQLDEKGDVTLEVTTAASHTLNTLYTADPRFQAELAKLQANGEFKLNGHVAQLGNWFIAVHDQIVDRTL